MDCQPDRVQTHQGNKALGVPVRELLDWANSGGMTHPQCGWYCPKAEVLNYIKRRN